MAAKPRKSKAGPSSPRKKSTRPSRSALKSPEAASATSFDVNLPVYEVHAAAPRIFDASDELLSRVRMQWQFGDWASLQTLDLLAIEHHPARAELALISGCAALQAGKKDTAQPYLAAAEAWGCDCSLMARLLLAGVANSLGRYHALIGHTESSEAFFLQAATGLGGDPRLAARARQQQELLSLPNASSTGTLNALPTPSPAPVDAAFAHSEIQFSEKVSSSETQTFFQLGIRSYAQNFEDLTLWRALQNVQNGFYIDIGAQHPVQDSVSKSFYEKGWRGIHVEATSAYAKLLREDRPDEIVIEAAISNEYGILAFYEIPGTGISTGDADIATAHKKRGFDVRETTVTALTLPDIFALAGDREIHWLKIDVEGMEKQVLEGWGNHPKRPWILVVEATLPLTQILSHEKWEHLLTTKRYRFFYFDGLSRFYIDSQHPEVIL